MKLERLCRDTHVRASIPKLNYPKEYAGLDASVRKAISEFTGVKTDFSYDLSAQAQNDLMVSLILSDFTSVFPVGGQRPQMLTLERTSSYLPKGVTISPEFAAQLRQHEGQYIIKPGYLYRNDKESQAFIRDIEPLAESGRLMIRPTPIVLGLENPQAPEGNRKWKLVTVEPNTPGDSWFIQRKGEAPNAIPLKKGPAAKNIEVTKCSFMVPYLRGLSFEQLSAILDDENELLTEFRKGVKDMLDKIEDEPSKADDIVNDIVRPATDKVQRKFRTITNVHRIKIAGGVLGAAVVTLTALTTAGIAAALLGLLGAGGLGFAATEYADYLKDKDSLRDMPFYLLWRLRQESRE